MSGLSKELMRVKNIVELKIIYCIFVEIVIFIVLLKVVKVMKGK